MNGLRRFAAISLAVILGAFVATAGAAGPTKQFSLAFNPGSLAAGNNPGFMLRIKNESPNGNSSINSIDIRLPAGHTVYAAPTFQPAYTGNIDWSTPGRIRITNMYPLGRGSSAFLNVPINVSSSAACAASGWDQTVAWTGSSLSGETFAKIAPSGIPAGYGATTTPSGSLTLAFGTLPTSFVAGSPYAVSVSVTSTCGSPPPTAVTLAAAPAATGTGTQTTSGGQTTFNVTFNTLGPVTLTASAPPPTSSITFSSTVFPNGSLACGSDIPQSVTNPSSLPATEPGYAFGKRGDFNAKGSDCELVNYGFDNKILTDKYIANAWDTLLQPDAAFYYSVNWQAKTLVAADLGYPPVTRPRVAWEVDGSNQLINETDGLACLSTKLPRPYGRLPSAIGTGLVSFTLDQSSPPTGGWESLPTGPFPIVIAGIGTAPAERMTATASGTTLTLTSRADELGTSAGAHAAGAYVMSTPMPIDPRGQPTCTGTGASPYCGKAVRMCIVSHGWQAYTPDPTSGATRYFWVTDAIDNGDGFMSND